MTVGGDLSDQATPGRTRAAGRLGTVEEVADLVAAVVANAYLSNRSIVIDGGTLPT